MLLPLPMSLSYGIKRSGSHGACFHNVLLWLPNVLVNKFPILILIASEDPYLRTPWSPSFPSLRRRLFHSHISLTQHDDSCPIRSWAIRRIQAGKYACTALVC